MLNRIIKFSLNNRILVLLITCFLLIGGTIITFNSEVDVFPDLNAPTVTVMTEAHGYAPEEVEKSVTFPMLKISISKVLRVKYRLILLRASLRLKKSFGRKMQRALKNSTLNSAIRFLLYLQKSLQLLRKTFNNKISYKGYALHSP